MESLARMKCEACHKGSPTVTPEEVGQLYPQIPDWMIVERDGVQRLERVFQLKNFADALTLANKIGVVSEEEGHHPVLIVEWGRLTVTWWTHAISGLHRNDFIMAAKTDQAYTTL